MLRPKIKEYAESGDVVGLHYIFRDALDADPTFEYYLDSYRYCEENVPNFFDAHRELTSFSQEPRQWDNAYWVQMKMDLMENFSKERYEHLRKVAKVYYVEKIQRIREEERQKNTVQKPIASPAPSKKEKTTTLTQKEADLEFERRANQIREEAAKKNREAEEHMAAQRKELEQARKTSKKYQKKEEDDHTKKLIGAVLIVVIAAVAVFLLFRGSSIQPTQSQVAAVMTQNPSGRMVYSGLMNILVNLK